MQGKHIRHARRNHAALHPPRLRLTAGRTGAPAVRVPLVCVAALSGSRLEEARPLHGGGAAAALPRELYLHGHHSMLALDHSRKWLQRCRSSEN